MGYESAPVYNDDLVQEIWDRSGKDTYQVDHDLLRNNDKKDPIEAIRILSGEMIEEDLSQMERGETLLGDDAHQEIIKKAYLNTIQVLGSYIPEKVLQSAFPGLDLNKTEEYDFSQARVKVFVLSTEDFDLFEESRTPGDKKSTSDGLSFPAPAVYNNQFGEKTLTFNVSERMVVVAREVNRGFQRHLEKHGTFPRELTPNQCEIIKEDLVATITHEIVHHLGIAQDTPEELREGITEWYAHLLSSTDDVENEYYRTLGSSVGYPEITSGVTILMDAMMESGMELDTINKAFVTNDPEARKTFFTALSNRYGEKQATRIEQYWFHYDEDFYDYVRDLESRKDSKLGEFLRTTEP